MESGLILIVERKNLILIIISGLNEENFRPNFYFICVCFFLFNFEMRKSCKLIKLTYCCRSGLELNAYVYMGKSCLLIGLNFKLLINVL